MENFTPAFQSLEKFQTPDWFRDAKFGIWSHWGPQSVPMFGDWYARNLYIQGTPQNLYHVRHYGHPSQFGYKDICALWKAENFHPDELMDLYVKAGAKYFVAQAMHHDHFFNYPSALNRMNSQNVGPHKDIVGLWKAAADRYGLPFGLTEHLGASFSWWRTNKGSDSYGPYKGVPYDGNDPVYRDFYHDNYEHPVGDPDNLEPWYTGNQQFRTYWVACMKELIERYTPDMLYSDGGLPFAQYTPGMPQSQLDAQYREGLDVVSALYNASIRKYGQNRAIYTQKDRHPEIYHVGVLDIEKSQLPGIQKDPWQTDTCIGNWFYDVRQTYKHPDQIIEMLIDIVSKNGTMLLNVLQRPDGAIDDEAKYILTELATWFPTAGEGLYGTRPWKVSGEGDTFVTIQGFTEAKTGWKPADIRYTKKGNTVYAFLMGGAYDNVAVLRSFNEGEHITGVRLLGVGAVPYRHEMGVLTVALPEHGPNAYTNVLAVELAE